MTKQTAPAPWYVALNTFDSGAGSLGRVLSRHHTYAAAARACRAVQPREPHSYLPTRVVVTAGKPTGEYLYPEDIDTWATDAAERIADYEDHR